MLFAVVICMVKALAQTNAAGASVPDGSTGDMQCLAKLACCTRKFRRFTGPELCASQALPCLLQAVQCPLTQLAHQGRCELDL